MNNVEKRGNVNIGGSVYEKSGFKVTGMWVLFAVHCSSSSLYIKYLSVRSNISLRL